MSFIMECNQC